MGSVSAVITVLLASPLILLAQGNGEVEHHLPRDHSNLLRAELLGITAESGPEEEIPADLKPADAASHPTAAEPASFSKKKVVLDAGKRSKYMRHAIQVSPGELPLSGIGDHISPSLAPTSGTRSDNFGFRRHPRGKIWVRSRMNDLDARGGVAKSASHWFLARRENSENVPLGKGRRIGGNHAPGDDSSEEVPLGRKRPPLPSGKMIRRRRSAARTHPPSPCPEVFAYIKGGPRGGKWYGVIALTTDKTITGVTLNIQLDKPAKELGAWLGGVKTENNKDFTIKNMEKVVKPNAPLSEKIVVQYNEGEAQPPIIQKIIFNGNQICPKKDAGRPSPVPLHTGQNNNNDMKKNPYIEDDTGIVEDEIVDGVPCGRIEPRPTLLIAHGEATVRGDWPWHAAIYEVKNNKLKYVCGGSVIGKQTILTAAHCVSERQGYKDLAVAPDSRIVFLGKHLLKGLEEELQIKEVAKIHVHPEYSSNGYEADIAVIVLSSPIEFTEYVKPVCLWDGNQPHLSRIEGRVGVAVGWGFNENGILTESLMKATMPVVSQQTCILSYGQFFSTYTSDRTFCAGYRNGTSVCNGDSGGGMFFAKRVPGKTDEYVSPITWTLRGIVSLSVAKEDSHKSEDLTTPKKICDTSHYAIFADAAKYYFWIKQYL